jgi:hypothetical protein
MDGGRLDFSIGDNGQMFCPFLSNPYKKSSIGNQNINVEFETG